MQYYPKCLYFVLALRIVLHSLIDRVSCSITGKLHLVWTIIKKTYMYLVYNAKHLGALQGKEENVGIASNFSHEMFQPFEPLTRYANFRLS